MAKNEVKTNGLFAFWKHGRWPTHLGGEITAVHDDGTVSVKGFDHRFTPVMIVPLERGLEIKDRLNFLEKARRTEQEALDAKYDKAERDALKEDSDTVWRNRKL